MKQTIVMGVVGLSLVASLPALAQQSGVKPSPYTTSTKELADQRMKASAELNEKLMRQREKRKTCRAEARAQKIPLLKRRKFVRECSAR
jgi:hypothetical protein